MAGGGVLSRLLSFWGGKEEKKPEPESDFLKGRKPEPEGLQKTRKDGWIWQKDSSVKGGWKRVREVRQVRRKPTKKPRQATIEKKKIAAKKPKPEKSRRRIPTEGSVLRGFDAAYKKFIPEANRLVHAFDFNYSERLNRNTTSAADVDNAVRALRTIADDLRNLLSHTNGAMVDRLQGVPKDNPLWAALKSKRAEQILDSKKYGRIVDGIMRDKIIHASKVMRSRLVSAHSPATAARGILYLPEYSLPPEPHTGMKRPDGSGSVEQDASILLRRKHPAKMWDTGRYVESSSRVDGDYWVSNGFMRIRASLLPPSDKKTIQGNHYGKNSPEIVRKSMSNQIHDYDNASPMGLTYSSTIGKSGKPRKVIFEAVDGEELALPQGYVKFFISIDPNCKFQAVRDEDTGLLDEEKPVAVLSSDGKVIGMVKQTSTFEDDYDTLHRRGQKRKSSQPAAGEAMTA